MKKSIILLSGGLDSLVSLNTAIKEYNIKLSLTFDYGQKAKSKEIETSKKIAEFYNINHKVIKLPFLQDITKTALVNEKKDLPDLGSSNLDDFTKASETAKIVWVPNRNGLFLNIAASFCDSGNFTHIIFGANQEEGTTFPDNTQDFIDEINKSFEYSTLQKPKVYAPLINIAKKDIVKLAIKENTPINLVRSCYKSEEKHCGKCESCLRLKRALAENNAIKFIEELF